MPAGRGLSGEVTGADPWTGEAVISHALLTGPEGTTGAARLRVLRGRDGSARLQAEGVVHFLGTQEVARAASAEALLTPPRDPGGAAGGWVALRGLSLTLSGVGSAGAEELRAESPPGGNLLRLDVRGGFLSPEGLRVGDTSALRFIPLEGAGPQLDASLEVSGWSPQRGGGGAAAGPMQLRLGLRMEGLGQAEAEADIAPPPGAVPRGRASEGLARGQLVLRDGGAVARLRGDPGARVAAEALAASLPTPDSARAALEFLGGGGTLTLSLRPPGGPISLLRLAADPRAAAGASLTAAREPPTPR